MIETLVLFGHLVVAGMIIALVLLQRGKGAEAGTGFGAGASGTVFGSRGSASFFSRATAVLATLFFASSLALAFFSTQSTGPAQSLVEGAGIESDAETLQAVPDDAPLADPDLDVPVVLDLNDVGASAAEGDAE
jgi:preprotein translocase subunit SecG